MSVSSVTSRKIVGGLVLLVVGIVLGRAFYRTPAPKLMPAGGDNDRTSGDPYATKPSEVRIGAEAQFTDVWIKPVEVFRYKDGHGVFSSTRGSGFFQDLSLGIADAASRDARSEAEVYQCVAKTTSGTDYEFLSTRENCWGNRAGKRAGFTLPQKLPNAVFLPLHLCEDRDAGLRYLSLNSACESENHTILELLGYIRATKILQTP